MASAEALPTGSTADAAPARRSGSLARKLEIIVPVGLLVLVFGSCFVWPLIGPVPSPVGGDVLDSNLPPLTEGHLLGTDPVGNDIWSRLLYGGRTSLIITLAVNLLGLVVGGSLGALSAYLGGIADAVLMRILDVFIAFPSLVITLAIAQGLGPSRRNVIFALAFFSIPAFARIARASTLRLREQVFISAAALSGTKSLRVLYRHIAPNILPQLVTFGLLGMGIVIIVEGALSFLGLGVPPPAPSWGNMIYQGQQALASNQLLVLLPSAFLFVTVLAFNLLEQALRSRWSAQ